MLADCGPVLFDELVRRFKGCEVTISGCWEPVKASLARGTAELGTISDHVLLELDDEVVDGGRGLFEGADKSHNAAVAGGSGAEGKM